MSSLSTPSLYSICLRWARYSTISMLRHQHQRSVFTLQYAASSACYNKCEKRPRGRSEKLCVKHYETANLNEHPIRKFHSTVPSNKLEASSVSEADYELYAEETLDSLTEFFEDLPETEQCSEEYDCAYGSGVLTIHLGSIEGTFVINKQTPNKQIWLSSPLSGPKRYDYLDGQWIYLRDGNSLHRLLEKEMSKILGFRVDLRKCKFYGAGVVKGAS